jgi:hypothetical protein
VVIFNDSLALQTAPRFPRKTRLRCAVPKSTAFNLGEAIVYLDFSYDFC